MQSMLMFICFQSGKQLFIYIDTSKLVWVQPKKRKCSDSARSQTLRKKRGAIWLSVIWGAVLQNSTPRGAFF